MLRKERQEKPFYPNHLFTEAIVAVLVLAMVMLLAHYVPVPSEPVADPTDTSYIPRPEWYFLFLFQALKYFHGPAEVLGTFLLPTVFILILILLPFYDRNPAKRWSKRPLAISLASVILVGVITLTLLSKPVSTVTLFANPAHGKQVFASKGCDTCHTFNGTPTTEGPPDLLHVGSRLTPDYIYQHTKDPSSLVKGSEMPRIRGLNDQDIKDLTAYLTSLK